MTVHDAFRDRYGSYVDGEERPGDETFTVFDPATGDPLTAVTEAGPEGVDAAVEAAQAAQDEWADRDPVERGRALREVADRFRAEAERFAAIETVDCGRPTGESRGLMHAAAGFFEYYAGMADKVEGETIPVPGDRHNYTVREPLGVIGVILPWNGPLLLGARSIPAALACGNAVVVKPAPEAPVSTLEFAALVDDVLPSGVFNVVPGDGPTTGAALVEDDRLGRVMFTGSREVGRTVLRSAADNIVPVGLELGGKNPNVVFPDADVDRVVEDSLRAFYNAGQVCFAPTRLFVHESIYEDVLGPFADAVRDMTVGPGVENPDLGPLITPEAQERVAGYVEEAVADGARVRVGGGIPREAGNFYAPTILENVADDAPVACDEVFGPVIVAHSFESESEVVRRANAVDYGLNAVVWTNDLARAHRVAGNVEAGSVTVNEYPASFAQAPSGPYKESGLGREKGKQAVEEYTNLKNVNVSLSGETDTLFEE